MPQTDAIKEASTALVLEATEEQAAKRTQYLADQAFASGMFPVKNAAQAEMLMHIARARQIPEVEALLQFHLIPGPGGVMKPSMTSQAMQASFQKSGGRIIWLQTSDDAAVAEFSHPIHQPTPLKLSCTWEQYKNKNFTKTKEGGVKDNWRDSRDDMLAARLVSKGVRRIHPGLVNGIYSPEEISDMAEEAKALREQQGELEPLVPVAAREAQRERLLKSKPADTDPNPLAGLADELAQKTTVDDVMALQADWIGRSEPSLKGDIKSLCSDRLKALTQG